MEETKFKTLKPSESGEASPYIFPPHRKSHLKSKTYSALVSLLSYCHNHLQSLSQTPIPTDIEQEGFDTTIDNVPRPENLSVLDNTVANESSRVHELATNVVNLGKDEQKMVSKETFHLPNSISVKKKSGIGSFVSTNSQDDRFGQAKKNSVDREKCNLMGLEGFDSELDVGVLGPICEPSEISKETGTSGIKNLEHDVQDSNTAKDEQKMVDTESVELSNLILVNDQTGGDGFVSKDIQDQHYERLLQELMKEETVGSGAGNVDDHEWSLMDLDVRTIAQVCEPSEINNGTSTLAGTNMLENLGHDIQEIGRDLKSSCPSSNDEDSSCCVIGGGEREEGEIPDASGIGDEIKIDEEIFPGDTCDKENISCDNQRNLDVKATDLTSHALSTGGCVASGMEGELQESKKRNIEHGSEQLLDRTVMNCKRGDSMEVEKIENANAKGTKQDDPLETGRGRVFYGDISEENVTQSVPSTQKDTDVGQKRKRGPPSEERKAKKKKAKRMKRAEKNRQLGVKRLKLEPIVKPKTISYCRHYLMGRCQEGEKCKFSHDTTPLTKSTPCSYFARNSCMKGDDCPFDHRLSKYPCNNFVSKGFCSRGDDCLFSHKLVPKDGSPSTPNVKRPELKSPPQFGIRNVMNGTKGSSSTVSVSKQALKSPLLQGITKINNVRAMNNNSSRVLPSPSQNTGQSMAKTMIKPPAQVPKGICFLSYGKSPLQEGSGLKQASLKKNDDVKARNQMSQNASDVIQSSNETEKKHPAVEMTATKTPLAAPKGINFLSFGNQSHKKENCLPSSKGYGIPLRLQDETTSLEQLPKSSAMNSEPEKPQKDVPASKSNKLPTSGVMAPKFSLFTLPSSQSSELSGDRLNKNTPSSSQKSFLSALAFAAEYESQKKMDSTAGKHVVNHDVNKDPGSSSAGNSRNDPMRALTVLDLLFGSSSKTK